MVEIKRGGRGLVGYVDSLKSSGIGMWKHYLTNPEFTYYFRRIAPTPDLRKLFLYNSILFAEIKDMRSSRFDPKFVLLFRRTLPSYKPKPEEHWSISYYSALSSYQLEIQGAYRLHSKIFFTSLGDLQSDHSLEFPIRILNQTELELSPEPYDQKRALLSFRPKDDEHRLRYYLLHGGKGLKTVRRELALSVARGEPYYEDKSFDGIMKDYRK